MVFAAMTVSRLLREQVDQPVAPEISNLHGPPWHFVVDFEMHESGQLSQQGLRS